MDLSSSLARPFTDPHYIPFHFSSSLFHLPSSLISTFTYPHRWLVASLIRPPWPFHLMSSCIVSVTHITDWPTHPHDGLVRSLNLINGRCIQSIGVSRDVTWGHPFQSFVTRYRFMNMCGRWSPQHMECSLLSSFVTWKQKTGLSLYTDVYNISLPHTVTYSPKSFRFMWHGRLKIERTDLFSFVKKKKKINV